ncbi:hypothetical protein [Actinoplanes subtropicus]|uniref:hypothetical protein n=1 Tax=Actinoplanes subtropicus TaxID=543632 RepID=UPI0004C324A1|nr:hypothetical protein [Actinoplanes subtropicus]
MKRRIALTVGGTVAAVSIGFATWHSAVFAGTSHRAPAAPAAEPSIANGVATFQRTARLADVASACTATANAESPGAVVLRQGLDDAHVSVTLSVPCAIQLAAGGFSLRDVRLSSRTLNISDSAFGQGQNTISLYGVSLTGSSDAGLLVALSDPAGRVTINGGSLRYPAGIAVQARGDRSTVLLSHTTLSARGPGSAGIAVTASTKHGVITGTQPKLDADAIGFVADHCAITLGDRAIDCGAARLAGDLQAQLATP